MQVLVFISVLLLLFILGYIASKKPEALLLITGIVGLVVFIYALWLLSGAIIKAF